MIPEEPCGLPEVILVLRSKAEARIQFECKTNLSSF